MTKASTYEAKKICKERSIKILVDTTIFQHSITHETAWVSTAEEFDGVIYPTGYLARTPVHSGRSKSDRYRNVCFLPGIAHLAREGFISLLTSAELEQEAFRQPIGRFRGNGIYDYNILAGIAIHSVDGYAGSAVSGRLLQNKVDHAAEQRDRIKRKGDNLYYILLKALGQSNSQDAWHLRTSEQHGCEYYLTMDFKFTKTVAAQANSDAIRMLRTKVVTPEQISKILKIKPINPNFFSYTDASFPVNTKWHMPDEQRRRRRYYKSEK